MDVDCLYPDDPIADGVALRLDLLVHFFRKPHGVLETGSGENRLRLLLTSLFCPCKNGQTYYTIDTILTIPKETACHLRSSSMQAARKHA